MPEIITEDSQSPESISNRIAGEEKEPLSLANAWKDEQRNPSPNLPEVIVHPHVAAGGKLELAKETVVPIVTSEGKKSTLKAIRKVTKAPVKGSSANSIIKGYEDKIALLLYAEGGGEPEAMGKEARELFLQYQKDKQQLKDKFVEKIQKL